MGYPPQREIAASAYEYQRKVDSGELPLIGGVNMFRKNETTRIELHKVDPESRRRSIERVKRVKENRDVGKWSKSLDELRRTAEKDDLNIFPAILNAIRSRATVGEISRVLREEWGGNTSRSHLLTSHTINSPAGTGSLVNSGSAGIGGVVHR